MFNEKSYPTLSKIKSNKCTQYKDNSAYTKIPCWVASLSNESLSYPTEMFQEIEKSNIVPLTNIQL